MFNISSFLQRLSKSISSVEIYKKQISEIIEKNTKINIRPEDFEIKDYVVKIKSSGAVKNKIFIYKSAILSDISKILPIKIVDIR